MPVLRVGDTPAWHFEGGDHESIWQLGWCFEPILPLQISNRMDIGKAPAVPSAKFGFTISGGDGVRHGKRLLGVISNFTITALRERQLTFVPTKMFYREILDREHECLVRVWYESSNAFGGLLQRTSSEPGGSLLLVQAARYLLLIR
jgi:hypothetical protein